MKNVKNAAATKTTAAATVSKKAATKKAVATPVVKAATTKKTLTAKIDKPAPRAKKVKAHKPWSVNGRTGYHQDLKGFKEGDKVNIQVDGKKVTATYKYFKISPERYPEGRVHVEYKGEVLKRVKEAVTKIAAKTTA